MASYFLGFAKNQNRVATMNRGRGRGASRGRGGRGASRGRGGRGASRGRGGRGRGNAHGHARGGAQATPIESMDIELQTTPTNLPLDLDINTDAKPYFINTNVTLDQHIQAQTANLPRYLATLFALNENNVEIGQKAKACVLAAAWCRHDHKLANNLLCHRQLFTLTEVLKAITMLDAARQVRVYEKQLKRLELSQTKPSAKKLGYMKNNIDNLNKLKVSTGSASGAIARHIQRWTRTLTQRELEYFALHMPTEPWRKLADIVHFNPTKDFPALPWFLPFCFGTPAPEENMVSRCRNLTAANVNELIKEFKIPYSHLKQFKAQLSDQSKARIASYEEKLDTILWYYEDLECPDVDEVLSERLRNGEQITLPYGKLMDRLLLIRTLRDDKPDIPAFYRNSEYASAWGGRNYVSEHKPRGPQPKKAALYTDLIAVAEKQLQTIKLTLESPVGILADASYSMEIAIRTATILSSLLTAICSAKLTFFHDKMFPPAFTPKNIEDVLTLALTTNVAGGTANAAALLPYYQSKEVIKTFIMVTDEEENDSIELPDGSKTRFFKLFLQYREEVYPAKLVFISFLAQQHNQGQMFKQFQEANIPDVIQFKFNRQRPDLTKFDNFNAKLSINCERTWPKKYQMMMNLSRSSFFSTITQLVRRNVFEGELLDIGCGIGDNAIYIAKECRNVRVTGIDLVPKAIEVANEKARKEDVDIHFQVVDMLDDLAEKQILKQHFYDVILDAAVFHVFSDVDREKYIKNLEYLIKPNGLYIQLCFSEKETREGGPRRIRKVDLHNLFSSNKGWTIESIEDSVYQSTPAALLESDRQSYLTFIRRQVTSTVNESNVKLN
ncbi:unnamed protein product [Adineta ricciae]|uniref:Methyltransferase domain-containing protein n=1 Tax=Adineta ricciae TaxID=249248 RepID=A0A815QYX6_ADIRI|nr:unnamed protein product [Adineta ricciae]